MPEAAAAREAAVRAAYIHDELRPRCEWVMVPHEPQQFASWRFGWSRVLGAPPPPAGFKNTADERHRKQESPDAADAYCYLKLSAPPEATTQRLPRSGGSR